MDMDANDVLAELKSIGALGRPAAPKAPAPARVDEVAVEEAAPEAPLIDKRGEAMVALLTDAIERVSTSIKAQEGLREVLMTMRQVWTTETFEEPQEAPQEALQRPPKAAPAPKAPPTPSAPPEGVSPGGVDLKDPVYQKAREAALRKIRGEDIPPEALAAARRAEMEEDRRGTIRATLDPSEGETTVGTLGTIKPSFPEEAEEE
jgi:hypothetical protein